MHFGRSGLGLLEQVCARCKDVQKTLQAANRQHREDKRATWALNLAFTRPPPPRCPELQASGRANRWAGQVLFRWSPEPKSPPPRVRTGSEELPKEAMPPPPQRQVQKAPAPGVPATVTHPPTHGSPSFFRCRNFVFLQLPPGNNPNKPEQANILCSSGHTAVRLCRVRSGSGGD